MMTGRVDHAEIGALLGILATRVPTGDEIAGAAAIMRKHVRLVDTSVDRTAFGHRWNRGCPKTFNVSTAAAIVAAAGPRCQTWQQVSNRTRISGASAGLLGVNIQAHWEAFRPAALMSLGSVCLPQTTIQPPNMSQVPVRKAPSGFPTIFNLLGPLTNPVQAGRQLMGVCRRIFGPGG